MATILVAGATGNVGVAAVTAALRTKHHVLAIVRNQASAEKLFKHVGTRDGITTVEADVMSEHGVQKVVDRVKAGELPAFQHVFSTVGGLYDPTPIYKVSAKDFRHFMSTNFEPNFYAYRATVPYLLEQNHPKSTWTIITGAAGDSGSVGLTSVSQCGLFGICNAGFYETAKSNIRFNELYLAARVEYDADAELHGCMKASDFGKAYEGILNREDIKGCRVKVYSQKDLETLNVEKRSRM